MRGKETNVEGRVFTAFDQKDETAYVSLFFIT